MVTENDQNGGNNGHGQMVEGFIDKPEVARRLRKKIRTIDNWMRRGILPYYKIGRSVSFKWSECEAHLAKNCRVVGHAIRRTERKSVCAG